MSRRSWPLSCRELCVIYLWFSCTMVVGNVNANCSEPCDEVLEYCDAFNGQCRPCRDLCEGSGLLKDCLAKCEKFTKRNIFHSTHLAPSVTEHELRQIQIMLIVIMSVSLVVLVLLLALVATKCQSRRSRRLREKRSNEVVPLQQFQPQTPARHSGHSLASSSARPPSSLGIPGLAESSSNLGHGKSMQTMTTQISDLESGLGNGNSNVITSNSNLSGSSNTNHSLSGSRRRNGYGRRSPPSHPPRIPDEDSVLQPMPEEQGESISGFVNHGLVESPTSSSVPQGSTFSPPKGRLPAIPNGKAKHLSNGGKPYTISHSQVV